MAAPLPRFCEECGSPLTEGARFCVACGRRLESVAGPTAPAEVGPTAAGAPPAANPASKVAFVAGLVLVLAAVAPLAFPAWFATRPTGTARPARPEPAVPGGQPVAVPSPAPTPPIPPAMADPPVPANTASTPVAPEPPREPAAPAESASTPHAPSAEELPGTGDPQVMGGDFEHPAMIPGRDGPVIVPDPEDPRNRVARILGPDELGFTLPVRVPRGTAELKAALRLLHPLTSNLIPFEDGRSPEGIRLRVRLLNAQGNSVIRDTILRPTGNWRELEFTFYDPPTQVVAISVEAIWMSGPIYVDDVRLSAP